MYGICDDDYTINVDDLNSLINTIFNGKKLGFCGSDIDCMI